MKRSKIVEVNGEYESGVPYHEKGKKHLFVFLYGIDGGVNGRRHSFRAVVNILNGESKGSEKKSDAHCNQVCAFAGFKSRRAKYMPKEIRWPCMPSVARPHVNKAGENTRRSHQYRHNGVPAANRRLNPDRRSGGGRLA